MEEFEKKKSIKLQVAEFLKEKLNVVWDINDERTFFDETDKISVRDIVWLFVWMSQENHLEMRMLHPYNETVSMNGFAQYFYEAICDENCCSN